MLKTFKYTGLIIVVMLFSTCGNKKDNASTVETAIAAEETDISPSVHPVDIQNSSILWKGEMLNMYTHEGNISLIQASFVFKGMAIDAGYFVVDMTSIVPTDKNYDEATGKTAKKLVEHLASPDFFDVAKFPTATFEVTSATENTVTGDLTIRGITRKETIQNMKRGGEENKTISGTLTFNRKNYEVAFDHPMKEMVLSDDIVLEFNLKLQ